MPISSYHGDKLLWGTLKLKPDLDFRRCKRENTHQEWNPTAWNDQSSACTASWIMISYFPPSWFPWALRQEINAVSNTRFSSRSRHKPNKNKRTHPQHEARHPPCYIRPYSFPRSKGRSTPRTAFPLLVLRRHRFPGSKGRSSAPTQVTSHYESWSLVLSLLLLLLLLPPLLLQRKHGTRIKGVGRRPPPPQISPADPAADASFLGAIAPDATGAAVPPVDGVASVAASDDTAPADDSRAPTAPLIDAAEGTVPLVAGSAADISANAAATADDAGAPPTDAAKGTVPPVAGAAVNGAIPSAEAGALAAPPTDAVGKIVPPVAGAAAGTAANTAPADDAGASATSFDDAAGKTRMPVTASAAGAAATSVTAVGADCCGPSDWENIGISILSDWTHSSKAESEITTVGGERVPLGGCSHRWWRACKGGPSC